jgi:hypothetical protein
MKHIIDYISSILIFFMMITEASINRDTMSDKQVT